MFCYQLRKHVGALAAALGGLDTLVFTGGIGERAAPVRWRPVRGSIISGSGSTPSATPPTLTRSAARTVDVSFASFRPRRT